MDECQDPRALGPHLRTSTSPRPSGFNFASLILATQQPLGRTCVSFHSCALEQFYSIIQALPSHHIAKIPTGRQRPPPTAMSAPLFWSTPLRYIRWAAHEKPAILAALCIGAMGPISLAAIPPIRHALGDVDPEPIPLTYPSMNPFTSYKSVHEHQNHIPVIEPDHFFTTYSSAGSAGDPQGLR